MTDELRTQLSRLDPMPPDVATEPVTTLSSRHRMERVMSSIVQQPITKAPQRRRAWTLVASGIAAVSIAAVGFLSAGGYFDREPAPIVAVPVEFSLGESDSMAMCLAFDVEILRPMEVAFEGTATAVDGDTVTLRVDHWYKGGDAEAVSLVGTQGLEALIDGINFEVGEQYLITATDGNVNYCGFSGVSTPELRSAFDEAFGS